MGFFTHNIQKNKWSDPAVLRDIFLLKFEEKLPIYHAKNI
jgi:hypothetical protein